jgi:hypothetical protein
MQSTQFIASAWNYFFDNYPPFSTPIINYCFYGYRTDQGEKMLVVEDNFNGSWSPIILAVKIIVLTDGKLSASCYAIVKSKTIIINPRNNDIITQIGDSYETQFNKIKSYQLNNPGEILAYYIPNDSLSFLHVIRTEKPSLRKETFDQRKMTIRNTEYLQAKKILFGFFLILNDFQRIFTS